MPGTTTARGVPYSEGSDKAYTIDDTMKALAQWVDGDTRVGLAADRGSATKIGEKFVATDTGDLSIATALGSGSWLTLACRARVLVGNAPTTALNYPAPPDGDTLILGALSDASVSGAFTRVASGSGHVIRCAFAGLYRVTTAVITTGGTDVLVDGAAGFSNGTNQYSTISFVSRVNANGDLRIFAKANGGSGAGAGIDRAVIERVGS